MDFYPVLLAEGAGSRLWPVAAQGYLVASGNLPNQPAETGTVDAAATVPCGIRNFRSLRVILRAAVFGGVLAVTGALRAEFVSPVGLQARRSAD